MRQGFALPRGERGGGILLEPPEAALLIFPFPPLSPFCGIFGEECLYVIIDPG